VIEDRRKIVVRAKLGLATSSVMGIEANPNLRSFMDITSLLQEAVSKGASDLHLSSGMPPILRIDGDLIRMDEAVLSDRVLRQQLEEVRPNPNTQQLEQDFSYEIKDLSRFRVNIFHQLRGISAVFRVISKEVPSLESLSMPPIVTKLCNLPKGLVLVTGPTGCGKSTTLAAMIRYINSTQPKHILTLEDPIEYTHIPDKCLIQQREVHHHTESFQAALRSALREDPDVILLGEMRDLETIRLALTAAETGHLVFATLHTSSCAMTIDRIIDVFPAGEKDLVRALLSESLQAVISQNLIKKKGGGRIVTQEIMICTSAIRNLIRENKTPQIFSAIQTGQAHGMNTMEQSLKALASQRLIDAPE